jgi:hypothetical protein
MALQSVNNNTPVIHPKKLFQKDKTKEAELDAGTNQLTPAQKAILHPNVGTKRVDAYIPTYGSMGNAATYKP